METVLDEFGLLEIKRVEQIPKKEYQLKSLIVKIIRDEFEKVPYGSVLEVSVESEKIAKRLIKRLQDAKRRGSIRLLTVARRENKIYLQKKGL